MIDIDAFLADAVTRDTIDLGAKPTDHFGTRGGVEWGDAPFRLRSGHVLDFNGATLELDVDRVTDEMLRSENPIMLIPSQIGQIYGKTGEDAWAAVSTHQCVKNVRLVANFSKLVDRTRALGVPSLRISGAGLQGHDAQMSGIVLSDFGAYGHEAFPLWIAGSDSGYDKNALYTVDPRHVFDEDTPSSRMEYKFVDYQAEKSNDQVTVGMIIGATCAEKIRESPWAELGPWRQIMRRAASLTYDVTARGQNIVQGGTIYQCLQGLVDGCSTDGAAIGVYGDYFSTRGLRITANNKFMGGTWGVAFRLSPTAQDADTLPEQFSHEDYVIEKFECDAGAGDVYLNADLPNTDRRYIRNMAVDERLRLVNEGNRAGVVKIPAPGTKKKGCRPW